MDVRPTNDWRARFEIAVLLAIAGVIGIALVGGNSQPGLPLLDHWLREDGVVEWLTVMGLILCAAVCVYRVMALWAHRRAAFLFTSLLAALAFLFGAGEEISWGQRLFGLDTPGWFAEHNRQDEINLHNLVIGEQDLNKLLFGKVLTLGLALFLFLPVLYRRSGGFRRLADRFGVPVARSRHALILVATALLLPLLEVHGRASELFEFSAVFLVLLILLNPLNHHVFERRNRDRREKCGGPVEPNRQTRGAG